MGIVLRKPDADGLRETAEALRDWQDDAAPMQLHPGDVGWFWRFGAEATIAAVRTWSQDGRIIAVGLLDGDDLLRLTAAPGSQQDEQLASQLAHDVMDPERGVLPGGRCLSRRRSAHSCTCVVRARLAHRRAVDPAAARPCATGAGKPGLLEPMGVHRDHRGHGFGTAIAIAAAAALQRLGSSSALVCAPSSNVGAVATYASAGFQQLPQRRDRYRDA
ncbi:GNAT family N-acetyltransferase [Leifsonia sp. Root112D2]|uniref:GNAT family N-acetyltransferase n=1 Tax=Leifsonia sp. Root112D2 TaxID=1736426 RepID=UPI000A62E879|nr:GNAT family N-acetyltransferase [Leifsonia sp. Root112D2]